MGLWDKVDSADGNRNQPNRGPQEASFTLRYATETLTVKAEPGLTLDQAMEKHRDFLGYDNSRPIKWRSEIDGVVPGSTNPQPGREYIAAVSLETKGTYESPGFANLENASAPAITEACLDELRAAGIEPVKKSIQVSGTPMTVPYKGKIAMKAGFDVDFVRSTDHWTAQAIGENHVEITTEMQKLHSRGDIAAKESAPGWADAWTVTTQDGMNRLAKELKSSAMVSQQ